MIGTTMAMAVMAGLFIVFGYFALADGRGCDGNCGGCAFDCENKTHGGLP